MRYPIDLAFRGSAWNFVCLSEIRHAEADYSGEFVPHPNDLEKVEYVRGSALRFFLPSALIVVLCLVVIVAINFA